MSFGQSPESTLYSDEVFRNIYISHLLSHPNIAKISDVELTYKKVYRDEVRGCVKYKTPITNCINSMESALVKCAYFYDNRKVFMEVASAVAYLCDAGIYHQMIRPEAIYLTVDKSPSQSNIAYLSDFGLANDSYTMRAPWTDPAIIKAHYNNNNNNNNSKNNNKELLIQGNLWSLGLFGVWLFCDPKIYDRLEWDDEDNLGLYKLLKQRFGRGLKHANVDVSYLSNDILTLIDWLMSPNKLARQEALNQIRTVKNVGSIDTSGFNNLNCSTCFDQYYNKHINFLTDKYPGLITKHVTYVEDWTQKINAKPITNKTEACAVIKEILSAVEESPRVFRPAMVRVLYNDILPKTYEHIINRNFWNTTHSKLQELIREEASLSDLYDKHGKKLLSLAERGTKP